MFGVGAVQKGKARRLARISVTLGVVLLFSAIGMTLTAAAPHENPPGQDQCDAGHGANDRECTPDNDHGQDCEEHGNGGVNEDHCLTGGGTTGETSTSTTGETSTSTTGETSTSTTGETSTSTTGETSTSTTGETSTSTTGETSTSTTGETSTSTTGETSTSTTGETSTSTTGETSTTTGGAENGTSTGTPVVGGDDTAVLGKTVTRKPLATTGNETTILAILGLVLLMAGSAMRFGRFGTRVAMATASPADALVARSLALIERTVRPGSRDWYCN